jgi:hypothetical protein
VTRSTQIVEFLRGEPAQLLGVMHGLADARDGWVNLQAVVDEDETPDAQPARAGVFALVSGRGPTVPVSSWVPGQHTRRGQEPDSVGIQHGAGPKAARRLVEAGVTPPEGSTLLGDHPRRGLVVELPPGTAPETVLDFVLAASDVLTPFRLPDTWVAIVHHR